ASLALEPKPDLAALQASLHQSETLNPLRTRLRWQDFSEVHSATESVFPAKSARRPFLPPSSAGCPTLALSGRPISDVGILAYQPFVQRRLFERWPSPLSSWIHHFILFKSGPLISYWTCSAHRCGLPEEAPGQPFGRPLFRPFRAVNHWYFNPDTALRHRRLLFADTPSGKLQSGYINGTPGWRTESKRPGQQQRGSPSLTVQDGCWRRPGPTARTSRPCSAAGSRCALGSTASVHSRTFGSSESSPEDQCSVAHSLFSTSTAEFSSCFCCRRRRTASRRRKSLVLSNAVSEELGEDLDVTDAGFGLDSFAHPCRRCRCCRGNFITAQRYHSSPLAMAYQRLNSVCEGSGLRRTASWRAVIEDCEELCEGKLDNSMTHRLRKPATLEHVDSGENMKRVLRHGQDRDRGHLGVGNGDEGRTLSGHRLSELADKELLRKLEASDQLYEQFDLLYQLYLNRSRDSPRSGQRAVREGWLAQAVVAGNRGPPPEPQHAVINSPLLRVSWPPGFEPPAQHLPGQGSDFIVRVMGSEMGRALGLNGEDY
uniref:Transmembrane protein n=1 Tax=Macrostomum lignano TaxID=282301 RepID=A0A1I8FMD4_9PLAT